ncbi:FixH family protein [Bacillus sp. RG28]|uniref:FixH family protein n=1 Tax=Gottfriedia endophytica TaxID=2820819 RepID=A0A940NNV0_9BACI|nr:FixH family protein [Gottfriedia endophytica]MBP0725594.1 FixH family protein [Gottfriedia endophytica]
MKKYFMWIAIVVLLAAVVFIYKNNDQGQAKDVSNQPIDVKIELPNGHIKANEQITIKAKVTQGGQAVKDADEVKFQIGENGQQNSEMLDATNQKDGTYSVNYTFKQDGNYYVVAHVTARDMHMMPKELITVGNPTTTVQPAQHQHGEEHHHGDATIHVMGIENIVANKENMFMIHVQDKHGQPISKANVRLESWQDVNGKHEFIDAKEVKAGEYEVKETFTKAGKYSIKAHVEKPGIHEHTVLEITVK